MIPLPLPALADVVGGDLVGDTGGTVTGVSIDSRTIVAGDLFVPLVGEHVDGHRFAAQAMAAGAAAWLCGEDHADLAEEVPGAILVDDPMDALTGLGAWVRDEVDPVVVAITGSNGKTTTKDLAAAAIGEARTAGGVRGLARKDHSRIVRAATSGGSPKSAVLSRWSSGQCAIGSAHACVPAALGGAEGGGRRASDTEAEACRVHQEARGRDRRPWGPRGVRHECGPRR